jgi:hypothetical protein
VRRPGRVALGSKGPSRVKGPHPHTCSLLARVRRTCCPDCAVRADLGDRHGSDRGCNGGLVSRGSARSSGLLGSGLQGKRADEHAPHAGPARGRAPVPTHACACRTPIHAQVHGRAGQLHGRHHQRGGGRGAAAPGPIQLHQEAPHHAARGGAAAGLQRCVGRVGLGCRGEVLVRAADVGSGSRYVFRERAWCMRTSACVRVHAYECCARVRSRRG